MGGVPFSYHDQFPPTTTVMFEHHLVCLLSITWLDEETNLTHDVIRHIIMCMIRTFKCRDTEKLFNDLNVRRFRGISRTARLKLEVLNAAVSLNSLRVPPGNRLEQLKGSRKGQHSIRVNSQWRICFKWEEADATDVEIVDYHKG